MWGLKTLGRGLVTILISPLILIAIAALTIYGLIVYFIYEISSIYLFFLGKNFTSDDDETQQLKTAMAGIEPGYYKVDQPLTQNQQPPQNQTTPSNDNQNGGNNNV